MNKKQTSIKLNFVYNLAYRISGIIIPLITTPYISRVLGAEQSGVYSYTYTITWYFVVLGLYGFENYGNRQIASARDNQADLNKEFSELYCLQIFTSLVAIIAYVGYLLLSDNSYKLLLIINGLYVLASFLNISWFYYGIEKFRDTSLRIIFSRILGLILIFILVKNRTDLWKYALILSSIEFFSQFIFWVNIKKYVSFVKVSFAGVLKHFKGCTLLFVPIILINIYNMMDKIMLGSFSTMEEVGFYTYAYKIVEVPFHIISALGIVMIPRMTNLIANDKIEESKKYIEATMKYNTLFASGACFGLMALSRPFSVIFFGKGYEPCANLINIMALMLIVRAWANVCRTQFLMPNHRDIEYIISLIIGVVTNLVLNILLIPKIRGVGAAFATLIAETLVAISQIVMTAKDLPIKKYILPNIPYIIFGLIMFLIINIIPEICGNDVINFIIQITIGAIVYLILTSLYLIYIKDPLIVNVKKMFIKMFRH